MQSEINDDFNLPQAVRLRSHSVGDVKLIDILTDYNEITKKIGKLNRLLKSGMMNDDGGSGRLYL